MSPTATDSIKTNLGEAGSHVKQAASQAGQAAKGAAGAAGERRPVARRHGRAMILWAVIMSTRLVEWFPASLAEFLPVRISHANPEVDAWKTPMAEILRWKSFDGRPISGFLYRPPSRFTGRRSSRMGRPTSRRRCAGSRRGASSAASPS